MNRVSGFFESRPSPQRRPDDWKPLIGFSTLCLLQGTCYLVRGSWSLASAQAVAGSHSDALPERLIEMLVAVVAALLLIAAWRRQAATEIAVVAMGSALVLTAFDALDVILRTF
jgi:hypothetical protein